MEVLTVKMRMIYPVAAAFGVWMNGAASAAEPMPKKLPELPVASTATAAGNQELADRVANGLRLSGATRGSDVDVATQDGIVTLAGKVRSIEQADAMVRAAIRVPGVKRVNNEMKLGAITPVQALSPMPNSFPVAMNNPPMGAMPQMIPSEPVPLSGPASPSVEPYGPHMPPFAWPTYAPYPNASRVAYPEAYPYNAFPYIGPYYPFPKVPLGWRSVKLEWEDGHWYFGRVSTPHDYWRVRFW
jgi:hypothetical protein